MQNRPQLWPPPPSPSPPVQLLGPEVGRPMTHEMADSASSGWFCSLMHQQLGSVVARPTWYMGGDGHAASAGVHAAATCGLHAVNHALSK